VTAIDEPRPQEAWRMRWLVSYRSRRHSRGFDRGYLRYTHTDDWIELIDQHPLAWVVAQKQKVANLQDDDGDWSSGDEVDEIELIYSAIPCPDADEAAAWWRDNV
jgi:hypothetical protein